MAQLLPSTSWTDPSVVCTVVLQPLKEEPEAGTKSRDKFLVQSVLLTPERETVDIHAVWGTVPGNEVHEQKVRVAWVGDASVAPAAAAQPTAPVPGSANGAAAGALGGAGVGADVGALAGAGPTSPASAMTAASPVFPASPSYVPDQGRSLSAASPTVGASGASAYPDEKASAALSGSTNSDTRIKSLQNQLAVANSERGVPVQTVAILSFAIFVLTYIFF